MQETRVKIAFVILHYLLFEETKKAIESIRENCDTEDYRIVVVDNASPNDSFNELTLSYADDKNVKLIRNEKNLGFARGNNVGFRYARDHYDPNFIVMINNDIYVVEKHLYEKLNAEYKKSGFALAGVRIDRKGSVAADKPIYVIPTIAHCNYGIREMNERLFWMHFGLYEKVCPFLRKIYNKLHIFQQPVRPAAGIYEGDANILSKAYDVGAHGCCLIFSRKFIQKYDGLHEGTFMYGEEIILFTQMLCNGERTVYMPEIIMFHAHGMSTNEAKKGISKNKRLLQWTKADLCSYKILKKILVDYKNTHGKELHEAWADNTKNCKDTLFS